MKCFKYFLAAVILLFQSQLSFAANAMNSQDNSNLITAIEDYRFNDYALAIPRLEILHDKFPENLSVLEYLALSYQENEQPEQALPMFKAWLRLNNNATTETTRFAWLGLAYTYIKLHKTADAITTLKTWLAAHPNDIEPQINLGDVLSREQQFEKSNQIWDSILSNTEAKNSQKAAAWYYKAWIAYQNNNSVESKAFAHKSLLLDAEGAYAKPAKTLLTPDKKTLGFHGAVSVETFYNSNVRLIPDALTAKEWGGDKGVQSNLILNWAFEQFDINYIFSSTQHEDFKTYDLMLHQLSASWQNNQWRFKPSYENISLDHNALYQSYGLGVYYTHQDWTYHYTAKFKKFTDSFGINRTNLNRLGGTSHQIAVQTNTTIQGIKTSFSAHIVDELTKGDVTHDKSDSYYQLGGNITTFFPLAQRLNMQTKFDIYTRRYHAADNNILLSTTNTTKRSDLYTKLSTSVNWQPWKENKFAFAINLSYQKNASNYDESLVIPIANKAYSGWRLGGLITTQW